MAFFTSPSAKPLLSGLCLSTKHQYDSSRFCNSHNYRPSHLQTKTKRQKIGNLVDRAPSTISPARKICIPSTTASSSCVLDWDPFCGGFGSCIVLGCVLWGLCCFYLFTFCLMGRGQRRGEQCPSFSLCCWRFGSVLI